METINNLRAKEQIYKELIMVANAIPDEMMQKEYNAQLQALQAQINDFDFAAHNLQTTVNVFDRRADEVISNLTKQIEGQGLKFLYIVIAIAVIIFIGFFA